MQQTEKQQQQLQKQDGEQVEEDKPQTGTMTHHNELARKGTKTVHSNLICKLVMKQSRCQGSLVEIQSVLYKYSHHTLDNAHNSEARMYYKICA